MKVNEIIQEQHTKEGKLADAMKLLLPEPVATWILQRAHKGQYAKLIQIYQDIMKDEINPPKDPTDALHRAAKAVGLPDREVYAMFGDKGLQGKFT